MTALESKMYMALLGARTIVSATANVNPQAIRILKLMDGTLEAYKSQESAEKAQRETADATGD
jgi:dihydrodipicolinate synthase/N-acetylneuraminate lyase